jgi:hypothetical protein
MAGQKLQPVHTTSKQGLYSIVFEDIKVRTYLNKKMSQFCYCMINPNLTVFLEVAGSGYTTRLK